MEIEPSYQLTNSLKIGQTVIEIYQRPASEETVKKNLTNVYDAINDIALTAGQRGVDTSNWFINRKQKKKLKEDPKYHFL